MHTELKSELELIKRTGSPACEESSEMDLDPISEEEYKGERRLKKTLHKKL
jgi:hypothetical protein